MLLSRRLLGMYWQRPSRDGRSHTFYYLDRLFQPRIAAVPESVSGQLDLEFRHDAIVLQHAPLPSQISRDGQTKNVSMPYFEGAATQQSSRRLGAHNYGKVVFLCKCRNHFSSACSVLVHEQNNSTVELA
jgi:hypothetical protein